MGEKQGGKTRTDYDNIAQGFAESRKNMKWEELEYCIRNYIFPKIQELVPQKLTILDVGCGSGRLLEHLNEVLGNNSFEYQGVDMSAGMIEQAQKQFPENNFAVCDMLELEGLLGGKTYDVVFFVASFHHLETIDQRLQTLIASRKLLSEIGVICMTNWSLQSEINYQKYKKYQIDDSVNQYNSVDFSIPFGDYFRFYHSFSLQELESLGEKSSLTVRENREFENKKNIVSVFQK